MTRLSVRARLAFWNAGVLALFVGAVAFAGYMFVARTTLANIDITLDEAATAVANAVLLESSERRPASEFLPRIMDDFQFQDIAIAVYDPTARTMYSAQRAAGDSTRAPGPSDTWMPSLAQALVRARPGARSVETALSESDPARLLIRSLRIPGMELAIGAVHSLRGRRRLLAEMRFALAVGMPLVLLLATAGGYVLARKSLRPVAQMTERAAQIRASTLHERLPVTNAGDELGRLAAEFNELLGRLDRAFEQQRQFMADASHELRTPVAIISGEAELALSRERREPHELREALATIRSTSSRLQRIVTDLFFLARSEAGEQLITRQPLYLGELLADCVRAMRSLAAERDITLTSEASADVQLLGDEALLRRALLNLLDNAVKYTPPGGRVRSRVEQVGGRILVSVSDSGSGIPAEAQPHIFNRFYRHSAHNDDGGAGLGLAIARSIVEGHGGSLVLTHSDAGGSTFTVTLPAAS